LKLQLCDASPAALCNAFRYNYGDLEDCTMLLDIGAKTSNLLFFEKGKVFSRSINLGANIITQDFATEAKLKFDEAEKIKIAEGFVSLGGAYEEPDNPQQAAISKIARQFMTKLHIQVNQTMQFYRGQQGGSAPQRLFLSGGASIMPYTAQFFAEKLNVPVEYFNPFRNVQIDPSVDLEELSRVAHGLGEVVGLGLRNLANCPVEMNLMPESTLRWQSLNQKKPYFVATVISLVLVAFGVGFLFQKLAVNKEREIDRLGPIVADLSNKVDRFHSAFKKLQRTQAEAGQITTWLQQRYYWVDFLAEMRRDLIRSEDDIRNKMSAQKAGVDVGIWVERMTSAPNLGTSAEGNPVTPMPQMGLPGGVPSPAMLLGLRPQPGSAAPPDGNVGQQPLAVTSNPITLVCRAVNLTAIDPSANSEIAYAVENEMKNSPLVDSKTTQLNGEMTPDDVNGTFTFTVNVTPLNPLNF
jgi:hypothetical protein